MLNFNNNRDAVAAEYNQINFIESSGFSCDELKKGIEAFSVEPPALYSAKAFLFIAKNAKIAADPHNIFQDKICHCDIIKNIRSGRIKEMKNLFREETELVDLWHSHGVHGCPSFDFGHSCTDMQSLLTLGICGIIDRLEKASRNYKTEEQLIFYNASRITFEGMSIIAKRLGNMEGIDIENKICLNNIAENPPRTTYEALQLIYLYFSIFEFVMGGRLRTLGGLDRLLLPFYESDLKNGVSKEYICEIFKFFLYKIWAAKVPFDLPFMLGGIYKDGSDAVNELSYLIIDIYSSLNIYSPKIHIRVSDNTPKPFIKKVLESIKNGNSSFVFINDKTVIDSLTKVGVEKEDANEYVLIGCYEPSAVNEVPCTGAGLTNLAKILEITVNNGCDLNDGTRFAPAREKPNTFEKLLLNFKENIKYITELKMDIMRKYESLYGVTNPFPILSATMESCVNQGKDAYQSGAKYNNSSVSYFGIATVVDSLCVIKKYVYVDKLLSIDELRSILKNNWLGYESLQNSVLKYGERYGVNNSEANKLTRDITDFCADIVNNKPNGRGGVFKAGLFSIDHCYEFGKNTAATPDGRMKGEPISKNLNAVTGMDIKGVTALILSASSIDHTSFPNGTVLDFVLHPTAVQGEEGLDTMYSLVKTYFDLGGLGIHGNVLDKDVLKKAQANPTEYSTLQVRLCGWNVFFTELSKAEQDDFIKQAGGFDE